MIRTDAGGPEAEAHGELLGDGLAVFILLGKEDLVGLNLDDSGVGEDIDLVVGKAFLHPR